MNFIARDTDYAVRALIFMAEVIKKKPKEVITVDQIVNELDLPKRFTRRILQKLAKNKVLYSYKGKDGGFSFLILPSKIKLIDLMKIFQGGMDFTNCLLKGKICPNVKKCPLRKRLKKVCSTVKKELEKITITSLLEEEEIWQKEKL